MRIQAGGTTDWPWQPLADCGAGNPFFYHSWYDDMDSSLSVTGAYTVTKTTGTAANTPGDGGLGLLSTSATLNDFTSIQLPAANFTIPANGKKLFFEARMSLSDINLSAFVIGIINTTATPFAATDGVYFSKVSGSSAIFLNSEVGSVTTSVQLPALAYSLVNGVTFDLGFYINRQGDVLAFIDSQLVGFIPQSGTGTQTPPNAGAVARITAPAFTAAVLTPTVAIQTGAGAIKTLTLDFIQVQKER